jgi:tRNA A37 threonylcarbamoyladenosine dehydratase
VADLSRTTNDPLAAKARSQLRRNHNFPGADSKRSFGVPCVYSTEQLRYPAPDGTVCLQKSFDGETVKLDCEGGLGAVSMVTGTFGLVLAARLVDRILLKAAVGRS